MFVDVFIDFSCVSQDFESGRVDVEEVWGKGNRFPCKIGKNLKCSNWMMENKSVKFAENVGTSKVPSDNYERA